MRWLFLWFASALIGCSSDLPDAVDAAPDVRVDHPERRYSTEPPQGAGYSPCVPAGWMTLTDEDGNQTSVYFDGYCAEGKMPNPISDPPIDDEHGGPLPGENVDVPRPKPGDPVP